MQAYIFHRAMKFSFVSFYLSFEYVYENVYTMLYYQGRSWGFIFISVIIISEKP